MLSAPPLDDAAGAAVDAPIAVIEHEIGTLLHGMRSRIKVLAEGIAPGLQPAGFLVLHWVVANCPVRAGGIAAALTMDKSAVSRQLTVLRDGGMLATRPDPEDGRATILVATDAARAAIAHVRDDVRASYGRALDGWETGDVAEFAGMLRRCNASFA